jgi:hypothetical protein
MDPKLEEISRLLDSAEKDIKNIKEILDGFTVPITGVVEQKIETLETGILGDEKVIEGIFDGEMMVSNNGETYPVPPNYASKSKLVEGDSLKLTIANDGSSVFKQISPVERRSAIGILAQTDSGFTINSEGKSYKVLTASVTFYKAKPGDQVTIILPKDKEAIWAVLENVINRTETVDNLPPITNTESTIQKADEGITTTPETETFPEDTSDIETAINTNNSPAEIKEDVPKIDFPAEQPSVSDEQLLENLKNNLKNLEQPAFTSPENASLKPVDNIAANDILQTDIQTPSADMVKLHDDKPIAELDI